MLYEIILGTSETVPVEGGPADWKGSHVWDHEEFQNRYVLAIVEARNENMAVQIVAEGREDLQQVGVRPVSEGGEGEEGIVDVYETGSEGVALTRKETPLSAEEARRAIKQMYGKIF